MSQRAAAWLAWSTCALSVTLTSVSLLLLALNLAPPIGAASAEAMLVR